MKREIPTDNLAVYLYGPKWRQHENDYVVLHNIVKRDLDESIDNQSVENPLYMVDEI